jgi:hypothetical protein
MSFLFGAALIRVIGITAHPGAVATVPHGCPALTRRLTPRAMVGRVTTIGHAGSARARPWIRPPNVGITRRCWQASEAVRLVAHTGLGESRPGYRLRQQRRVHAVFGRAEHRSPIAIHKYMEYNEYTYLHVYCRVKAYVSFFDTPPDMSLVLPLLRTGHEVGCCGWCAHTWAYDQSNMHPSYRSAKRSIHIYNINF